MLVLLHHWDDVLLLQITSRAKIAEAQEAIAAQQRGQATPNGLHHRTAPAVKSWVSGEPLPDRGAQAEPRPGARPQWVADQNLVSEQKGENQEDVRQHKLFGPASDGTGTVQPLHGQGLQVRQWLVGSGKGAPHAIKPPRTSIRI